MRVMGKSRLIRLANGQSADACGASWAFLAELVEARWRSPQEATSAYPYAVIEAHRLTVPLDARHCVIVAINYELGLALIEYAGLCAECTNKLPPVGRRVHA